MYGSSDTRGRTCPSDRLFYREAGAGEDGESLGAIVGLNRLMASATR